MLECKPSETVIKFGDRGSLFYILLEGQVEIKIPNPVEIEVNPDDFILFCLRFYEDIYWKRTLNGPRIAKELIKELEKSGTKYDANRKDEME